MADNTIKTNKQSEIQVDDDKNQYNPDISNLTKNKSDNHINKTESEIQSSLPLSLDIGISEMKQSYSTNNKINNMNENDQSKFSSNNNFAINYNNNNSNSNTNINCVSGINALGNLNMKSSNFESLWNSNNFINKNSDFFNPLVNSHFALNLNKDNEFYAMPSPFIKDGINLSSLYLNTLTSKQLEFTQHPPLIQNM